MTLFDYISYTSTVIRFWLDLCILGTALIHVDNFCSHRKCKMISKIMIHCILSLSLSTSLYLRFQEYFANDVSSDMRFYNTPVGLLPISFSINYRILRRLKPSPADASASMALCNDFFDRILLSQIFSIVKVVAIYYI